MVVFVGEGRWERVQESKEGELFRDGMRDVDRIWARATDDGSDRSTPSLFSVDPHPPCPILFARLHSQPLTPSHAILCFHKLHILHLPPWILSVPIPSAHFHLSGRQVVEPVSRMRFVSSEYRQYKLKIQNYILRHDHFHNRDA